MPLDVIPARVSYTQLKMGFGLGSEIIWVGSEIINFGTKPNHFGTNPKINVLLNFPEWSAALIHSVHEFCRMPAPGGISVMHSFLPVKIVI